MKKLLFFILYIPFLINAQTFEETMEFFWLQHELEFQHQPIDHQFRSNDNDVLKLGDVIYNLFDIRKEEVYVLTINDGETTILETEDDIWNYDLLSQFRRTDDGLYTYRQTEGCSKLTSHIVLNLSYRTYDKNKSSNDKSISKLDGMLNIHLQYPSGIKNKAIYIQATFCHPPIMLERTKQGILPQPESKSILLAYDYRSKKENIEEFNSIYNSAKEKLNKKDYDNLTYLERQLLLLEAHPDIQGDFYWGKKKYAESSYWDAILYFENVYNALTSYFWSKGLNDDLFMLSESSFYIGMCYYDLGLHTKALKYIDFAKDINQSNYTYKKEYINCLIAMHDIRALSTIKRFSQEFNEIPEETRYDSGGFEFFTFLQRREIYCLVELNMINKAKNLLDLYLIAFPEDSWGKDELEYIKSIEKK